MCWLLFVGGECQGFFSILGSVPSYPPVFLCQVRCELEGETHFLRGFRFLVQSRHRHCGKARYLAAKSVNSLEVETYLVL